MMWWHSGLGGWGMGVMVLFGTVFWVAVIVGIVMLVRSTNTPARAGESRNEPTQVLAERFARGEIDEDEYRARRAVLRD